MFNKPICGLNQKYYTSATSRVIRMTLQAVASATIVILTTIGIIYAPWFIPISVEHFVTLLRSVLGVQQTLL
jgi:hypothetical protein